MRILVCNFPKRKVMKPYNKILFCLYLVLPYFAPAQNFDPKKVVPKSLSKYDFGMSLDEFSQKNKVASIGRHDVPTRIEYKDADPDKDIKQVTYYFGADNNQPLYEMIIAFNNVESLNEHCSKKLGAPNDRNQWKWTTRQGYTFKAWRFGTTLVLALGLPSTEWEKDWDN